MTDHANELRRHVRKIGGQLGVVRKDVADDEELLAGGVRLVDSFLQRGNGAEFVVAHAQAVTRLAGVNRVGAEGEGGPHHFERTGGGEEFGRLGHSKMLKSRAFYAP